MCFIEIFFGIEAAGEQTIKTQVKAYNKNVKKFPNKDPHFYLSKVWLSRMSSKLKNLNKNKLEKLSFQETVLFACLPPTDCARALGLHFLYKERPEIFNIYFKDEFKWLMAPVYNGNLEELYSKYNPNTFKLL